MCSFLRSRSVVLGSSRSGSGRGAVVPAVVEPVRVDQLRVGELPDVVVVVRVDELPDDLTVGVDLQDAALGEHTLTVTAEDTAGNTSEQSVSFTVVDTTPPDVTIHSPEATTNDENAMVCAMIPGSNHSR